MTVSDHRKLAKHSARVAKFHRRVQEERKRLEIVHKLLETPTTEPPLSGRPDMAVVTAMGNVNRDVAEFEEHYKHKPHPMYSPADIREYIEMKTGMISSHTTTQTLANAAALKAINRDVDKQEADNATYMEARRRIFTLCEVAPSIIEDSKLVEASNARIGLQNLHAWCVIASKVPKSRPASIAGWLWSQTPALIFGAIGGILWPAIKPTVDQHVQTWVNHRAHIEPSTNVSQ